MTINRYNGAECEWLDGCGMDAQTTVVDAFAATGGSIGAYVPPAPPDPPSE